MEDAGPEPTYEEKMRVPPPGVGIGVKIISEIQPNFVHVTYMNGTSNCTIVWVPAPLGLGEEPTGQISLNLNNKVNFKRFLNLFGKA